jgi:hypothetical protein
VKCQATENTYSKNSSVIHPRNSVFIVHNLYELFHTRNNLFRRAYFHKVAKAVDYMYVYNYVNLGISINFSYRCQPTLHFLLNLCFCEPTWLFYLKLNLSKTIYFLKRIWFLYVLSKYHGMFEILQWNVRLWKHLLYNSLSHPPTNSGYVGHASNPPLRY